MEGGVESVENCRVFSGWSEEVRADWAVGCGEHSEGVSKCRPVSAQSNGQQRLQVFSVKDGAKTGLRQNF